MSRQILTKLRDIYISRITRLLSENEEELTAHARGEGYGNMDELMVAGEELRQISMILGFLPDEPRPPAPESQVEIVTITPISWALWADQIRAGNYAGATACLSHLMEIDFNRADRCVAHFSRLLNRDPSAFARVQRIRQADLLGERCRLLNECFGLSVSEAMSVANKF